MVKDDEARITEIEEEIGNLFEKVDALRREKENIKTKDFDFIGKYIKFNGNGTYMFVYDVFPVSSRQQDEVLIRGVAFREFQCNEWDGSYFGWETDMDFTVPYNEKGIIVITKEEYDNALNEAIDKFLKNKKEFVDNAMIKWAEYNKNCKSR